jgi:hypothetical protein
MLMQKIAVCKAIEKIGVCNEKYPDKDTNSVLMGNTIFVRHSFYNHKSTQVSKRIILIIKGDYVTAEESK